MQTLQNNYKHIIKGRYTIQICVMDPLSVDKNECNWNCLMHAYIYIYIYKLIKGKVLFSVLTDPLHGFA